MDYVFAFVTALLTFISPCVLPMLPVFISYFTAADMNDDENDTEKSSLDMKISSSDLPSDDAEAATAQTVSEDAGALEDGEAANSESNQETAHETSVTVAVKKPRKGSKRRTLINAIGFSIGLMIVLVAIGALFAGLGVGLGAFLLEYRWIVNIVTGSIVIILGLAFIGVFKIPFLTGGAHINVKTDNMRFFSAILFGLVYAISFGPCVVTFGSFSIMQGINDAIKYGEIFKAVMLQVIYAGTLGILFIISAMLIDFLKGFFDFIKRHYKVINLISGIILIILGLLMAFGVISELSNALM